MDDDDGDNDDQLFDANLEITFIVLYTLTCLLSLLTYLAIKMSVALKTKVSFRVLRHFFLTAGGISFCNTAHEVLNKVSSDYSTFKGSQIISLIIESFVRYFRFSNVIWMIFLAYTIKYMFHKTVSPPPEKFSRWILWAYLLPIINWLCAFFFPYGNIFGNTSGGGNQSLYFNDDDSEMYNNIALGIYLATFFIPMFCGYIYSFFTFALLIQNYRKYILFEKAINGGQRMSSSVNRDQNKFMRILYGLIAFPIISFVFNVPFQIQICLNNPNYKWSLAFAVCLFLQSILNLFIAFCLEPVRRAVPCFRNGDDRISERSTVNSHRSTKESNSFVNILKNSFRGGPAKDDSMREKLTGGSHISSHASNYTQQQIPEERMSFHELTETSKITIIQEGNSKSSCSTIMSSPNSKSYLDYSSQSSQLKSSDKEANNNKYMHEKDLSIDQPSNLNGQKENHFRISFQEHPLQINEPQRRDHQSINDIHQRQPNAHNNAIENASLRHSQISSISTLTYPSSGNNSLNMSSMSSKDSNIIKNTSFFEETPSNETNAENGG